MSAIKMIWSAYPGETAACIAVAAGCAAMMAALLGLLMWPAAPEEMEDAP